MGTAERADEWARLTDELWAGMHAWRAQHPRATLYEIEAEIEARLGLARSRCWRPRRWPAPWPTRVKPTRGRSVRRVGSRCGGMGRARAT